ncbi:MAG: hypothetical protein ACPHUF_13030 [Gammaproteobacteria bacterium]
MSASSNGANADRSANRTDYDAVVIGAVSNLRARYFAAIDEVANNDYEGFVLA